jgi:hypothetical protein
MESERSTLRRIWACHEPKIVKVVRVQRLVAEVLRPGNASWRVGLFGVLRRIVGLVRERFGGVRIIVRADSGSGTAEMIAFCEQHAAGAIAEGGRARCGDVPADPVPLADELC